MGPTQSPYILQLFMGPSNFWRVWPPDPPLFRTVLRTDISDPYWGREGQRVAGQSWPVGVRRQATRCTCLTRCRVFLNIHAVLSLRHQETGTDVEVAACLHEVSTPAIARGVSLQAGKSSRRRITPPVRPVFTAVPSQPTTVSSLRSVLPSSAVVIASTMFLLEPPSGVTWQYFDWVGGT